METTPAGGRPSPTEAVEICPQGLLVFTGSSEKDSNLAKQFWITSSMYPTNESQLVMSRGSRQRLPVARVSKGGSGSEKICFRPCFIEKNKSPDVTAETPRTQGSEEKEKYLQKILIEKYQVPSTILDAGSTEKDVVCDPKEFTVWRRRQTTKDKNSDTSL
ncbi:UPF0722 protein C11orf88 homolog isoform X4 [Suricata suricatta]|uniref:UPF0722 protein C11orf88 homolog isoform X4 n=1 Tax=Suricata suricatta TaxID=37032 RepID=UPI00115627F1|nr:UPF0722 protein C11orf88 homolog isoform X4 [Suricata suricatta]